MGPRGCATFVAALVVGGTLLALPAPTVAAPVVDTIMPANWPIAISFSPDGRVFYAERNTGQIRIIENGTLLPTPFYTIPNTATGGERGLLGLALDPGFPSAPWVYAYQTYNDLPNGTVNNRIVRVLASGNTGVSMELLLRLPPLSGATNHNGGVIAFGPDGKLYVLVGENANIALAQNPLSPMGKVLRLNPNGSVPTDNPFYGNAAWENRIFSYGHRNMFGIAFHPDAGGIWISENGPGCNDEVNLLVAGGNFAWGTSQTCASPPPPPQNTNRDGPLPRQMPKYWWTPTICPTNMAIYRGAYFPGWHGDIFMGDCNTGRLHRLDLEGPGWDTVLSDNIAWTAPTAIIEVEEAPDGSIWFTTPSTIYRLRDANRPPSAVLVAAPQNTIPGVTITFDASFSTDPDGSIVSYDWEFGDGATGTGQVTTYVYGTPGAYLVNLTVTDDEGLQDRANTTVTINSPPFATFTANPSPAQPGQLVTFDASASADDGTIVSYSWEFGDGGTGTGVQVTHTYLLPGLYDVALTVTDDLGLNDRDQQTLRINAPPVASFTASPVPANPGQFVTFNASGSQDDGTIVAYAWDFGDGFGVNGIEVAHAYALSGTYGVVLTVTDDMGIADTDTRSIVINAAPVASFVMDRTSSFIGVPFQFTSTSSDTDGTIAAANWDFGDGTTAGGTSVSHAYSAKGAFVVTLTVTDDMGLTAATTRTAVVANRAPVITSASPPDPQVVVLSGATRGLSVEAGDPDADALSYAWRVDGVLVSTQGSSFDFSANAPGDYRVNVTVSDGSLADWHEWTVTVSATHGDPDPVVLAEIGAIVIAVILVLAFVLWRRRKRASP